MLLVGGGARKDFAAADLRGFAARVVKAGGAGVGDRASPRCCRTPRAARRRQERAAQFLAEGALLGAYKFDKYLTGDKKKPITVEEFKIVVSPDNVDGARARGAQARRRSAASRSPPAWRWRATSSTSRPAR